MKKPGQFSNLKPVSDDNNNKLELRLGPPVAPPPLVGWPPVGSFRKNLANNNSFTKPYKDDEDDGKGCETKEYLFVKINMEGIPIGRKVDLKAYDSYDKLSTAIDQLFIGLLAAQGDSSTRIASGGNGGEYTLVYEDYEGDTVLVGDVPWKMFVSTAKRLRVLKSSEIWSLQRKTPL